MTDTVARELDRAIARLGDDYRPCFPGRCARGDPNCQVATGTAMCVECGQPMDTDELVEVLYVRGGLRVTDTVHRRCFKPERHTVW